MLLVMALHVSGGYIRIELGQNVLGVAMELVRVFRLLFALNWTGCGDQRRITASCAYKSGGWVPDPTVGHHPGTAIGSGPRCDLYVYCQVLGLRCIKRLPEASLVHPILGLSRSTLQFGTSRPSCPLVSCRRFGPRTGAKCAPKSSSCFTPTDDILWRRASWWLPVA